MNVCVYVCFSDGLDMYPINPLNPAMYPEDRKYMCGHWLVEYEKLHQGIVHTHVLLSYKYSSVPSEIRINAGTFCCSVEYEKLPQGI